MLPRHLLLPLLLACAASGAQAAICRAAPTAGGAANGTTWADAMTLQSALANTGCDEIWLRQGLYKPGTQRDVAFAINRPLQLYGGFVGGETARGQRATDSRLTVLSGDINGNDTTDAKGIVLDANDQSGGNSYNVVYLRTNPTYPVLTRDNTVIDGLTITAGRADGGGTQSSGGGLRCDAQNGKCSPTLRNLTFSGNYASSGGAIYNSGNNGDASPLISHATFTGNVSGASGGAIYNSVSGTGSGSPTIAQSTFSGNRAGYRGGAIYNDGALQPLITFSTFYGNTAANQGGAIVSTNNAQATITASVFSLNTAVGAAKQILDEGSGTKTYDGNLVQGGGCGVGVLVPYGACSGSPLTGDPLLAALADNGGPTWTMLPAAGSPALDAATCSAGDTDQRGVARPTGACAIGAVERQAITPVSPTSISTTNNQVRQITVDWQPVEHAAAYVVATVPGGQAVCRTSATACVVTGLGDGQTYNFALTALNEAGSGSPAEFSGSTLALPGTPASFTTPGAEVRQATLSWTAPGTGGAVERYIVTDTATSTVVCDVPASSTGCMVGSLANGTAYDFALLARNAAGDSTTASTGATTLALPDTPAGFTATPGVRQFTLAWSAAAGATSYVVTDVTGAPAEVCNTTSATCTVTGLGNGDTRAYRLVAHNAAGDSTAASTGATTVALPATPTGFTATPGVRQLTLAWSAAAGATGYVVTDVTGTPAQVCSTSATTCTVTGLGNGDTRAYRLVAHNAAGDSTAYASAVATTLALPDAPAHVSATAGNGRATVAWAAPTRDGGSAITGYTVTATPGGATCTTAATPPAAPATACDVTGLANGQSYRFAVTATNAVGTGPAATSDGAAPTQRSFSATGPKGTVTASFTGGGATCTFDSASLLPAPARDSGVPAFAHGVLDFALAGCTGPVAMTVAYPAPLTAGTQYWKLRGTRWQTYPATLDLAAGTATFALEDGGPGDDGPAGDGRIVDPSGAGLLAAPASIPTLSQWGVLLLSGLLALLALRRGPGCKANWP